MSKNNCRYFVVEKSQVLKYHKFYFVVLISFQKNMEFCCNYDRVFSKIENYKLL